MCISILSSMELILEGQLKRKALEALVSITEAALPR